MCTGSLPPTRRARCPACDFTVCLGCQKRYLLELEADPRCMSCGKGWPRETLHRLLPRAFCDGPLRQRRERLLLERQRALLPGTQPRVMRELARRRARERLSALRDRREQLLADLRGVRAAMDRTQAEAWGGGAEGGAADDDGRAAFQHKCPAEGCRGFVNSAWKCGLCELFSCAKCNEVRGPTRDAPHQCRPEDVQAMRLIREQCRECPGCGTQISRVEGCNQMWCTRCHVAFDWRTGARISRGLVHNPHLHEWQQQQRGCLPWAEAAGGGGCGLPTLRMLADAAGGPTAPGARSLLRAHRFLAHTAAVRLGDGWAANAAEGAAADPDEADADLRLRYLMGELDEPSWSAQLQRREKRREKQRDTLQLLQMFVQVGIDLLRGFCAAAPADRPPAHAALAEFDALCAYQREQAVRLRRLYGCVVDEVRCVQGQDGADYRWVAGG